VYCGQTVGWIMLPLGTEVGLGLGHIVLDGDPASPAKRGTAAPDFSAHFALARSPISATAEILLDFVCRFLRRYWYDFISVSVQHLLYFITTCTV